MLMVKWCLEATFECRSADTTGRIEKPYSQVRKIELEYTEADDFQVDREGDISSDNCD